jgi:hypothetical protein
MAENRASGPQLGQMVIFTQTQTIFYPAIIVSIDRVTGLVRLTTFPAQLESDFVDPRALHPLRHYYRAVRPSPAHRPRPPISRTCPTTAPARCQVLGATPTSELESEKETGGSLDGATATFDNKWAYNQFF